MLTSNNDCKTDIPWILGTATFSKNYGIANKKDSTNNRTPILLLREAASLGITMLDTAPAYGESEQIIGMYHKSQKQFTTFTKISTLDKNLAIESVQMSIRNLYVKKLQGVYFHNHNELIRAKKDDVRRLIDKLKASNLTEKIGASVYTEQEIEYLAESYPEISLYQVPENILDRRLVGSKLINDLARNGYIFHVRSIFLQGLILMDVKEIPEALSVVRGNIEELKKNAISTGVSVRDLCINYAKTITWSSGIVIGASNVIQLRESLNYERINLQDVALPESLPPNFCDPRLWKF